MVLPEILLLPVPPHLRLLVLGLDQLDVEVLAAVAGVLLLAGLGRGGGRQPNVTILLYTDM